jgi:hypothetical protein
MNDIIVWDNGDINDKDERYTLLYGGVKRAFIFGESAIEDPRNVYPIVGIDIQDMDKRYKRISVTDLPATLIEAIKKRA